ncbi:Protein of unknown function DUF3048, C-terminal domain containing protein [Candidatus Nanopelagicaceae bacterium]
MNLKAMFFRRLVAVIFVIASCGVVITSMVSPDALFKVKSPFAQAPAENSVSGRVGSDGPVLVVKIDDTSMAHPQIGLEDADLVYIEEVEGGSTRLAAVFSSKIPARIGPVRSARISDVELLAQYGRVGFAYSGAQKKMLPVIAAANVHDLGAQRNSSTIFTTDPTRTPPYAMVLRADLLLELAKSRGLEFAQSKNMGWKFGKAPQEGVAITSAQVSWPASSYDVQWSRQENRWLLYFRKEANVSESGQHLGASTFVIQMVSITNSIYKDKNGGITPLSTTVGSGSGYILRNGKSIKATWSRPTAEEGTRWMSMSGEEITFEKGQIWVALTDREPVFTLANADAASVTPK